MIVFKTPGIMDIRALTTFGMSAKPATKNPIGFFGTGLKLAIAVLVRNEIEPILWLGLDRYRFYRKSVDFRGQDTDLIGVEYEKFTFIEGQNPTTELPFTVNLGRNWELWQAFRELEANTRDENGITEYIEHEVTPVNNTTLIAIPGEAFAACYHERETIFLPGAATLREGTELLQVFDGPGKYLYYRGLRVLELPKPALFTYNLLKEQRLTEDRTLDSVFQARTIIAEHAATSTDKEFVKKLLRPAPEVWEHGLEFDYQWADPTEEFKEAVRENPPVADSGANRYVARYEPPSKRQPPATFVKFPRPWEGRVDIGDHGEREGRIVDATGATVLRVSGGALDRTNDEELEKLLQEIEERVNYGYEDED